MSQTLSEKLEAADIAFARVNDVAGLIAHPHLRRISVETPSGPVSYPAPAPIRDQPRSYGRMPALGEHTEKVRKEFGGVVTPSPARLRAPTPAPPRSDAVEPIANTNGIDSDADRRQQHEVVRIGHDRRLQRHHLVGERAPLIGREIEPARHIRALAARR